MTLKEPLWTRQKGESSKAFHLFTIYRDFGPLRTIDKVRIEYGNNSEKPLGFRQLEKYSSKWSWVKRSDAYDDYMDELARKEHEIAVKDMIKRHADESKELQEEVLDIRDHPDYDKLTPTQKAWVLNSSTHSFSKLALLERLSRGESTERAERNYSGLNDFARTIESSIQKVKKSD